MNMKKSDSTPETLAVIEFDKALWHQGRVVTPPAGWKFLPSGDAALTRRVKLAGPHWVVNTLYRKKLSAIGLWAPADTIAAEKAKREQEQATPEYQKRRQAAQRQRDKKQQCYAQEFHAAVVAFLDFAPKWADMAERLAEAVTEHAVPIGSGTVARTERISIEERAEAAVIAWMRHQTSNYDRRFIAHISGERRRVRQEINLESRVILKEYRRGWDVDQRSCPLARALRRYDHKKKQAEEQTEQTKPDA
jgi:hypothetical protein